MVLYFKRHTAVLFLSIFFVKIAICLLAFKCNNFDQQKVYSVIMQLEIENEQHPNEEANELFNKENAFSKFEWIAYSTHLNKSNSAKISLNVLNFYPINHDYTEIVTPPPEFKIS